MANKTKIVTDVLECYYFLIPTKEASHLYIQKGKLCYDEYIVSNVKGCNDQYLYICSKRDIVKGNWTMLDGELSLGQTKQKDVKAANDVGALRVEFTNDPKLWDKEHTLSLGQTETIKGALPLPKRIWVKKPAPLRASEYVIFLEELVARHNFKLVNDEIGKIPAYHTGLTAEETVEAELKAMAEKEYPGGAYDKEFAQECFIEGFKACRNQQSKAKALEKNILWCAVEPIGEDWEYYPPNTFNKFKLNENEEPIMYFDKP